jgi:low affinity Fe/Cu permease
MLDIAIYAIFAVAALILLAIIFHQSGELRSSTDLANELDAENRALDNEVAALRAQRAAAANGNVKRDSKTGQFVSAKAA